MVLKTTVSLGSGACPRAVLAQGRQDKLLSILGMDNFNVMMGQTIAQRLLDQTWAGCKYEKHHIPPFEYPGSRD